MLGVDSGEIYPDTECRAQLLVQGIIDVYFEEEDGLVVLDYKTDRVRTADELVRRYQSQLTYYARACHRSQERQSKKDHLFICSWKGNQRLNGKVCTDLFTGSQCGGISGVRDR